MTYAAQETSVEGGKPIEIYQFVLGGDLFNYTSGDKTQTVDSVDYDPRAMSRTEILQGPEDRNQNLEITLPASDQFARLYITTVPGQRARLTVRRFHSTDTPTPQVITIFQGFVRSVAFQKNAQEATIAVLPISAATSRAIPRFTFSALCNHVLYDVRCGVDPDSVLFRHDGNVSSISGNDIVVVGADGFADGFFNSGFVDAAGGLDSRMVLAHTGTTLTLHLPFGVDPTGSTVTVRAGCDHTITTCFSKFDAIVNYGGFAFIPTRNIFTTGLQ